VKPDPGSVVPCFLDPGQWSACFGLSWHETMLRDALSSQRIVRRGGTYLRKVCGAAGISEGRNELARQFLDHTDGEWLWFIDSDMGFSPDTVDRLIEAADPVARPVVGALCFGLRRLERKEFHAERFGIIPTVYSYVETDGEVGFLPTADYPRDELVRVAGTGMACALIHRSTLDAVRAKHGDAWFDPVIHPSGLNGSRRVFSEDLSFCVRAAGCDVPIHVHTGIRTTHEKGGVFLDEDAYDRQQAFAAVEAERTAAHSAA
jgi:hypothetical protein